MNEVFWYSIYSYVALLLTQGALCLVRKKSDFWARAYVKTAQLTHAVFWVLVAAYMAWTLRGAYTDLMTAIEKGNVVLAKAELKEFLMVTGFAFVLAFGMSMVLQSHLRDLFNRKRRTSGAPRGQELLEEDTLYDTPC
ncbi:hypothetical protein SAMN02745181_3787 [Rubritalea squalenifaciens DSM 18772]|uniref:Uncharacterized protein n=1 Tax=Rubritalea squalenifaciens DSM 18772 TaxID=1123071 RepID=A0A1M6SCE4_9BACT|nr:hypothetical protein [Rubritalea squalenifaciens]SHK42375.1 hypothetical protein SAMN02745181_3787 [Rubritalea squalenifaciens DSM 18772]